MNLLIDGGYLSFLIGAVEYNTFEFKRNRSYSNYLWLLDGLANYRKTDFPQYKANRKRNQNQKSIETRKRVNDLRRWIKQNYPKVYQHDNLEADDLIALFHYQFPDTKFVTFGNDKDMLQVPDIILVGGDIQHRGNIKQYKVEHFKAAKAIKPHLSRAQDLLFYQALFGDRTDNIPRILESRAYDKMANLMQSDSPFSLAAIEYPTFFENLKLVILPHINVLENKSKNTILHSLDLWYSEKIRHWIEPLGINNQLSRKLHDLYNQTIVSPIETRHIVENPLWQFLNDEAELSSLNILEKVIAEYK